MTAPIPERPLVTFAVFAFNQERYIRDAVEGAFSQTYEPLEIILSDDCSIDRTFDIMKEMTKAYKGVHNVVLRQNRKNLGLAEHFNEVVGCAKGEILVIAAGDDVSLSNRTSASVRILGEQENNSAVLFSADIIDSDGKKTGERLLAKRGTERRQSIRHLVQRNQITFGATRAIKLSVLKKFGKLKGNCPTEDTPLLLRSLIVGDNVISAQKLVLYRKHQNNLSSPESLRRMSISPIYSQYSSDIDTAESAGFASKDLANELRLWVINDKKTRTLRQRVAGPKRLNFSELRLYLSDRAIPLKSKILVTARTLRRLITNS